MLNRFLDIFPPGMTIMMGGLYFIMPIMPEPHLVQKMVMLRDGVPLAPIDWLDIVLHSSAGLLAVLVYRRDQQRQAEVRMTQVVMMPKGGV